MKKILFALLALALAGAGVGYYLWNKPHQKMESAKADVTIEAAQLFQEYNNDETGSNAKFLDKTIAVSGTVKEAAKSDDGTAKIILETGSDFGVSCELDPLTQHARIDFQPGEKVTFKGKCAGLNLDVQLARCVEVK